MLELLFFFLPVYSFSSSSLTTLNPTSVTSEYHQTLFGVWGSVLIHCSVLV